MNHAMIVSESELKILKQNIVDEVAARVEQLLARPHVEAAASREEMAQLLGVGVATIDRLVRDGIIPSMMPCNRRLFLPSRVFAALENTNNKE